MWLINANTYKLEWVVNERKEIYAILSHRWEDEEVSFQDIQNLEHARTMKGFSKIYKTCEPALAHGHEYAWVDTCCINKESSAELSEAINSMYRWYAASVVCFAYLSDVDKDAHSAGVPEHALTTSLWFTRGWTLQELVAPREVQFYDCNWLLLGTKHELSSDIAAQTRIDEAIINGQETVTDRSVAQRMCWASGRETTRDEDIAYCLLGIFGVNMPMLYGEGQHAFIRLQEEIVRYSDDATIFAWTEDRADNHGLFATSPNAFTHSKHIYADRSRNTQMSFSLSNKGIRLTDIRAFPWTIDTYFVQLGYLSELEGLAHVTEIVSVWRGMKDTKKNALGLLVRKLWNTDLCIRVRFKGNSLVLVPRTSNAYKMSRIADFTVRQNSAILNEKELWDRLDGFRLFTQTSTLTLVDDDTWYTQIGEEEYWIPETDTNTIHEQNNVIRLCRPQRLLHHVTLETVNKKNRIKVVKLGFDFDWNPVCYVYSADGLRDGPRADLYELLDPLRCTTWSATDSNLCSYFDLDHHRGLWALKADRLGPKLFHLPYRNARTALRRAGRSMVRRLGLSNAINVKPFAEIVIERGEFEGKLVWEVQLDELRRATPKE